MISTPEILETKTERAAVIRLTIARNEMMKLFGPAVGELMAVLQAQGVTPTGAVFARHYKITDETFDFDVGVGVDKPVAASGRVTPGELPAAKVARTIYSGPYEGLPAGWGEFTAWLKAHGHEQAGDLWEVYNVGPQSTPDPAQWRTELNRPLKA